MAPPAPSSPSARSQKLKAIRAFLFSRRCISVLKGALAFTLSVMLPLIPAFDRLNAVPLTYSAGVVIAIAGFPGKSTGECFFGAFVALLGVGLGAGNFAILSLLHRTPIAQAVVFAIMVYVLALMKAYDARLFAFALLAILMTFNGVYISILTDSFSPTYLESYFKSYLWGGVIVLGVNLLVFPISSEKELKQTLVLSLDHIGTFAHLLAKTYTLSITDDERQLREQLNQTIRADFGLLTQKVGAAAIEINYSRWSIQDYKALISQTRAMQLSLIALNSSLASYAKKQIPIFEDHFLPSSIQPFHVLRRDIHRTIIEIQAELGCKASKAMGSTFYETYFDLERQDPSHPGSNNQGTGEEKHRGGSDGISDRVAGEDQDDDALAEAGLAPPGSQSYDVDERLRVVSERLQQEAERAAPLRPDNVPTEGQTTVTNSEAVSQSMTVQTTSTAAPGNANRPKGCARRLLQHFDEFEAVQRDLLTDILASGRLLGSDKSLHIRAPLPSIWDTWGPDVVRGQKLALERENGSPERMVTDGVASPILTGDVMESEAPVSVSEGVDDAIARASNHSLMRVFSVLYALRQFSSNLAQTHAFVKRRDSKGRLRTRRFRFHIFDGLFSKKDAPPPKPWVPSAPPPESTTEEQEAGITNSGSVDPGAYFTDPSTGPLAEDDQSDARDLSMREAMALLEGREYIPTKSSIWNRLDRLEAMTRTPLSIYAFKVTGAALVFGALLWADGSKKFFQKYTIAGSLLTIVVALTPTLGQSLRSFVFQISGSGMGFVIGLIFLEIFKNVGGYLFNPYGVVCLVAIYSIPMSYLLYEKPQLFTFVLLAMNACGVLIISDYVSLVHNHNIAYGYPPIRVGRSLAGLAIALAIVIAFQLLVLRNPARRTLRKALAHLVYSNLSYNNILQALVRATMPADRTFRAPQSAIDRVQAELAHREKKIQADILATLPLVAFAKDEPQLSKPFQAGVIAKIIRANQIILDRQSEARAAIGTIPFSSEILKSFVAELSPYRTRITRIMRTRFCLSAASLMSKTPLPHETKFETWLGSVTHDALVQSQQFASTEAGKKSIQSGEFTRYWFYLLTVSSLTEQLGIIEDSCRALFGEIEDDPRLT